MEDFFTTIYYWTNNFYSVELDSYLYDTTPGYLHVGVSALIISIITCAMYYYLHAPVRKQTMWWWTYAFFNAIINICVALWYTVTPLINNEIEPDYSWSYLDCFAFSFTNAIWSFVFFVVASLLIKWWSVDKYVPFQKF